MKRMRTLGSVGLALVLLAGCATGRSLGRARSAEMRGDWEAAVGYYREALERDPGRTDLRIGFERASRQAARLHFDRGYALEPDAQVRSSRIALERLAVVPHRRFPVAPHLR